MAASVRASPVCEGKAWQASACLQLGWSSGWHPWPLGKLLLTSLRIRSAVTLNSVFTVFNMDSCGELTPKQCSYICGTAD